MPSRGLERFRPFAQRGSRKSPVAPRAGRSCGRTPGTLLVRRRRRSAAENYRQSRSPLRDHRRLPPAAAALVQEIGEGILILLHVPCELEDDRLIFVHGREATSGGG